jgi:hypothetical protein
VDEFVIDELGGGIDVDEVFVEGVANFVSGEFAIEFVSEVVDVFADLRVHGFGQVEAVFAIEDVGDAAFAGLGIDADNGFVGAANVGGIDGEVGDAPPVRSRTGRCFAAVLLRRVFEVLSASIETFLDGVLVGAGEGGEDEFAGVGLAIGDGHAGGAFVDFANGGEIGEVEAGFDAMGVKIEGDDDDIEVAGAFAAAEEGAFDAIGAGEEAEFGGGDAGAAVVMGVEGDMDLVAAVFCGELIGEPFDLVGVDVGGGPFDGGGKVEDDGFFGGGLPDVHDGLADLEGEIEFGIGEGFG